MANISPVGNDLQATGADKRWRVWTWETITEADTPLVLQLNGRLLDLIVQATGTWGGMTMALHGSVDGTTFLALSDLGGTEIAMTADALLPVQTAPLYIKPVRTGGASADVDVKVLTRFMN